MSKSSIIIAGDCCLRDRTTTLNAEQLYSLCEDIQPIVQSADAALVNLETAVVSSDIRPIKKAGPSIKTDARVLEMLHAVGFNGVTLANNHFADYGSEGVKESLLLLDESAVWHVGAGMNAEEAAQTKYLNVGGKRVAIINACEHEFTIATDEQTGCNALNPIRQFSAIHEAKKNTEHVLVIVHGGVEHFNLPTPRMQEIYRFFIEAGADAVINHHQHCYSGYEIYHGKPIVYGLGNFFFDWQGQEPSWNKGYMVKLTLEKEIGLELLPYVQNADTLGIKLMNEIEKEQFLTNIKKLNEIIINPIQLQLRFREWAQQRKEEYLRILQPSIAKNIKRLERMHLITENNRDNWLPVYMTEQRRLLLRSLFQCEAHNDVMKEILK